MGKKTVRVGIRVEIDAERSDADELNTRIMAALTKKCGLALDSLPRLFPKRDGRGYMVYVRGEVEMPDDDLR